MDNLWEFVINLLEILILYIVFNNKLERKAISNSTKLQFFTLLSQAILLFVLNHIGVNILFTQVILIILHFIYAKIFFKESNFTIIFLVIAFTAICILADTLTVMIPTRLFKIDVSHILTEGSLRIPFTLMYIFFLAFFSAVFLQFSKKRFRVSKLEQIIFLFFSTMFIVIEKLILIIQISAYNGNIEPLQRFSYAIFFSVMILFISLLMYIYKLGIEKEKNIQLSKIKIRAEMEQKQYEQIVSSLSELRYMKHDINNHLSTLHDLISKQNYTEAALYIDNLTESISASNVTLSTGNIALDSIIANKLTKCKSENINVHYSVHYPTGVPLEDYELCSLIGNLFDNAIDACISIKDNINGAINFTITPYNEMLSINMSNPSNGIYNYTRDKKLASTKTNSKSQEHGLGLKRVSQIVEQYNGIINISPETNQFKIRILIPLNTEH